MRLSNARVRAEGEASFVPSLREPTFHACMKKEEKAYKRKPVAEGRIQRNKRKIKECDVMGTNVRDLFQERKTDL